MSEGQEEKGLLVHIEIILHHHHSQSSTDHTTTIWFHASLPAFPIDKILLNYAQNEALQIDSTLKGAEIILHMITFQTVHSIVRLSSPFPRPLTCAQSGRYGISFDIILKCEILVSLSNTAEHSTKETC